MINTDQQDVKRDLLITGGSGFIGTNLIRHLEATGQYRTIVNLDLIPGLGEWREIDVRKRIPHELLSDFDFAGCVHLAGLAKEPGFEHHEYFLSNTRGTKHLLEACQILGIGDLIFTSTMMVHAPSDDARREDDVCDANTAYGSSKALAESEVMQFAQTSGCRVSVLRPGVVFGPGDGGNFVRLRKLINRRIFFYVGRRSTVKSCVHVDDIVGLMCHLLDHPEEHDTYNVAIPGDTTIEEIATSIQRHFGADYKIPVIPFRAARIASRPFELIARFGIDTGIHHRRIEKLHQSTNISTDLLSKTTYEFQHDTIDAAIGAWAEADERDGPQRAI